jgi:hypothetical protein
VQQKIKQTFLLCCLFLFLLVVVGGSLHLNPAGALIAAVTGTPLIVHAFNLWSRSLAEGSPWLHRERTVQEDYATTRETRDRTECSLRFHPG